MKVFPVVLLSLISLCIFACSSCGNDDDDAIEDDDVSNDDDPSADDDSIDDDQDNDDDDVADDDDDDGSPEELTVTLLYGGYPETTSLGMLPDGQFVIGAQKSHTIVLFTETPSGWTEEQLKFPAYYHDLFVDGDGAFHLLYQDADTATLGYATNKSGAWETSLIDPDGAQNGYFNFPVLDASGDFHVTYIVDTSTSSEHKSFDLRYARYRQGQWTREVIWSHDGSGYRTRMGMDAQGHVHACLMYSSSTDDTFAHATNETGSWVVTDLDATLMTPFPTATTIAVTSTGDVFIPYPYWSKGSYTGRIAMRIDGVWSYVDEGNFTFNDVASFVDPADRVHLLRSSLGHTHYSLYENGTWTTEEITHDGYSHSIFVDADSNVHFSGAGDNPEPGIVHRTNATGTWTTQTVAETSYIGYFADMDTDSHEYTHLAYYDQLTGNMMYATDSSGQWETSPIETIVSPPEFIEFQVIALDIGPDDSIYAAYYNWIQGGLNLAVNDGSGIWNIETFGAHPGIALDLLVDDDGNAHLCAGHGLALNYYSNESGTWTTETAAAGSSQGSGPDSCSIAVNSSGEVMMAYTRHYTFGSYDVDRSSHFATNAGGHWYRTQLHYCDGGISAAAIGLDNQESPCILTNTTSLALFSRLPGNWESDIVAGHTGEGNFQVDEQGTIHIGYLHEDSDIGVIRYAENSTGSWEFHDVFGNGVRTYGIPAVTLDSNRLRILFSTQGVLYLASFGIDYDFP